MSDIYEENLPAESYVYAKEFLNETKEVRDYCLKEVINWLNDNPHINAYRHPVHLLHFLRGAKFRLEKAKFKIELFYKMRAERIEWFSNRNPFAPEIDELLDLGVFLPLREKDSNGCQIFVIRTGIHNTKRHAQNDVLKVCKMLLDLVLHLDESISIYGAIAIFDMSGVTWSHGLQMTPTIIKRSVHSWENYSCKNKRMEFIKSPGHINIVLNTFRFFMSHKMKERLYVTSGLPTVKANLPCNIGGKGESYKELAAYWKKKVQEYAPWFSDQEHYKMIMPDSNSQAIENDN